MTETVPEGSRTFAEVSVKSKPWSVTLSTSEDAAIGVEIVLEDVIHQSCEVVVKTGQIGCGL